MMSRYEARWAWRHPFRWIRVMWLPVVVAALICGLALVATREVFSVTTLSWVWPILLGGLATALLGATLAPLNADVQTFVAVSMFSVAGLRTATFGWVWLAGDLSTGASWIAAAFGLHWGVLMLIGLRMPAVLEEAGRRVAVESGRDDRGGS